MPPDLTRLELLPGWTMAGLKVAVDAAQLRADALGLPVRVVDTDGTMLVEVRPEVGSSGS